MSYFRPNIDAMEAYVPGKQADTTKVIKLNTNENPYPPSPAVFEAIKNLSPEALRVYPATNADEFRQAASKVLDVPAEWILPGNGSDNIIVMLARACGGPIVAPAPTFPFYETQAEVAGVEYISVPFGDDFALPVGELIDAAGAVTFVANPNSPTGSRASNDELSELAAGLTGKGLLIVDEAYVDFTDTDAREVLMKHENVLLLRTLSKGYSLAGLRFGFVIGRPEILEGIGKAKEIYNVGSLTQAMATAAIADQAHKNANVANILASREKFAADLKAMGWEVYPSEGNFVLARPGSGTAKEMADRLKANDIYVRYFNSTHLPDALRITIGTDDQNQKMLAVMRGSS